MRSPSGHQCKVKMSGSEKKNLIFKKIQVFYEIVDLFVLDMCSKPILFKNCSERQNLLEVARTAKICSKRQKVAQKLPSTIGKRLV